MDQIWDLRGVGSQQDDPVAILDRQTPEWRSRMPIDLGDGQARRLIDSLLRDAATAASTEAGEFQVLRYITDTAAGQRFVVEPRVPRRMPAAGVARLVGIGQGDLPGRFQLRVDGSHPIPIANGRVAGDEVVFSGVLTEPEDLAAVADREIRWFSLPLAKTPVDIGVFGLRPSRVTTIAPTRRPKSPCHRLRLGRSRPVPA